MTDEGAQKRPTISIPQTGKTAEAGAGAADQRVAQPGCIGGDGRNREQNVLTPLFGVAEGLPRTGGLPRGARATHRLIAGIPIRDAAAAPVCLQSCMRACVSRFGVTFTCISSA
jgi:hypothetical protein